MQILAVTACPSGVAHTYMAAEALLRAAQARGLSIKVETQGSIGRENEIGPADMADAVCVILTTDMPIGDVERFEKLPKIRVKAGVAIKSADAIIEKIEKELLSS
ncbi:fructose PTS transporter subunit IIB [Collinsella sp. zg1085]|uniref:PTS fructose transporter subunit IIB n=1 Tax=Collinsella sp. zg1085 TaxID=2844380 RepID=UPI001C0E6D4D|nr:fructose PTS transporter subunit IIB [Collinsella sp. zg1085]QWT18011.1 fructose PTS transporter subunit IIB [Collinsella sp. zg1085]